MFIPLTHRALFAIAGEDRRTFLQGLVSADIEQARDGRALYGAFLTPQGKFLYDFFIAEQGDTLLLEVETEGREDFMRRLSRFKLRSKVALTAKDDWQVYAVIGEPVGDRGAVEAWHGGLALTDPRLAAGGIRAWLPSPPAGMPQGDMAAWDSHRIGLGLPDGRRDMVPEKTILLEAGFDELQGVDWQKGCFMGQEVTARSKYRGQIKKRLLPVEIEGAPPPPGTLLMLDGQEAGEMRSHAGQLGLAVIRLDCLDRGSLTAGDARLTPRKPDWLQLS